MQSFSQIQEVRQADNNLNLSKAKESNSREFSDYWWGLKKFFCFTPGQMNSSLLKVYEGNKRHPRIIQGLPLSGAYFINRVQLFQENVQKIKYTSLAFPWVNGCLWGEQLCTVSGSCVRSLKVLAKEKVTWLFFIIIKTEHFSLASILEITRPF